MLPLNTIETSIAKPVIKIMNEVKPESISNYTDISLAHLMGAPRNF
jgi:hypothetical protein